MEDVLVVFSSAGSLSSWNVGEWFLQQKTEIAEGNQLQLP